MSEISRWTPDQLLAIGSRGRDTLVSAAAGSGKTAVLVERVARMVTDLRDPLDISRLLVVTFTEAAAHEMKGRIAGAIREEMERRPEDINLRRQMAFLSRAHISTLHSFCLWVIKRYFHLLGLDPSVSVLDADEADLLQAETLEEVMEDCYREGDEGFLALVDAYGTDRGDEGVKDLVLGLYRYSLSQVNPMGWLSRAVSQFQLADKSSFDTLPWVRTLMKSTFLDLSVAHRRLERALDLSRQEGGPSVYIPLLEMEQRVLGDLVAEPGPPAWEGLKARLLALEKANLPPARGVDPQLRDEVQGLRKRVWDTLADLQDLLALSPDYHLADLAACRPYVSALADLVERFHRGYQAAKNRMAALDFSDLEHRCLELLAQEGGTGLGPSSVARELRGQFSEVVVDEYQDINPVQEAILSLLSRPRENFFAVGDVKQSIYRFRLADPNVFLRRYREHASGGKGINVYLRENFRSRRSLIEAVNLTFEMLMSEEVGGVRYDDEHRLVPGASYPPSPRSPEDHPVEIHLMERDESFYQEEDEDRLEPLEREAWLLGHRIAEMVEGTPDKPGPEFDVWDEKSGSYRPVGYGDIAVLMRAPGGRTGTVSRVLRQMGLPLETRSSEGYFAAVEVEVMFSLLTILENPRQDIPLASVLRSPIVDLDEKQMAQLRLRGGSSPFHEAVLDWFEVREGRPWEVRVQTFLENLSRWRTQVRQRPLSEVVWRLLRETGYLDYVGGMPGGGDRVANLLHLHDRAQQFDGFQRQGLSRFLRFLARLREKEADLGSAGGQATGSGAVRLMSIHASKGLEFPVVIVFDLGREFNQSDLRRPLLYHDRLGLGPELVDLDQRSIKPTLASLAVKAEIRRENLAEEMRILYVAMTRAEEKLILIGSARNVERRAREWTAELEYGAVPSSMVLRARSYLDWLLPVLARHRDGGALRALAGAGEGGTAHDARFSLRIWGLPGHDGAPGECPGRDPAASAGEDDQDGARSDEAWREAVKAALNYRYPHAALARFRAAASVSQTKDLSGWEPSEEASRPAPSSHEPPSFMQADPQRVSGAERGQATHAVIQHLNLEDDITPEAIARLMDRMVERELMDERFRDEINVESIVRFFRLPLGRWLRRHASTTSREVPFTLGLPPGDLSPDLDVRGDADDVVVVQGIIDWLVLTPRGAVLVDFKTDREVPGRRLREYERQLGTYSRAVELILGEPVRGSFLVFLESGDIVRV